MKPLRDNVLVAEVKREEKTAGGLILTSSIDKTVQPGKVIACGPDCKEIKVGDTILPLWQGGFPVTYEGKEMMIISEDSVIAIV